jgi:AAA15 family ATPase/GTPase
MNNHFLNKIEIKQFKCFANFKAEGFKRVNLISGKNNVGKTAFIEACYINVYGKTVDFLIAKITNIKFMRESTNLIGNQLDTQSFLDSTKHFYVISNVNKITYDLKERDARKEYAIKINSESESIIYNDEAAFHLGFHSDSFIDNAFINRCGWSNNHLIDSYKAIQMNDKENELNNAVNEFDSSIESFKIIGDKPQCKVQNKYRDITEFGDGLKHYISIICALYASENGYLFIDEIDSGIHYTQLDKLWTLIFEVSKKTNCNYAFKRDA